MAKISSFAVKEGQKDQEDRMTFLSLFKSF